ncbi:ATP-binding protein [Streptomyces sp. NPDC049577]|uniref:ATP-binding protein n=1 Tax=Streptomyces sp. NPDC049577 TaxID=3155153 RepID=UPI00343A8FE6
MRRVLAAATLAAAALTVGAAGSAGAAQTAAGLPRLPDLGALTAVDPGALGDTVDGAAQQTTGLVGEAGGRAVRKAVPTVGRTGGTAVRTTAVGARRITRDTAGSAAAILGETARSADSGGLPTHVLPKRLPAVTG